MLANELFLGIPVETDDKARFKRKHSEVLMLISRLKDANKDPGRIIYKNGQLRVDPKSQTLSDKCHHGRVAYTCLICS